MIHQLHLQNFKCFEDQIFGLKPLTVLSGLNSTGKSSVLQALLLLRQSYQQGVLEEGRIALKGDLVHIGTGKDALFEGAKKEEIFFELVFSDYGESKKAIWRCSSHSESDVLDVLSSVIEAQTFAVNNLVPIEVEARTFFASNLFTDDFQYLQAERVGPRRFFDLNFLIKKHNHLGSKGGVYYPFSSRIW